MTTPTTADPRRLVDLAVLGNMVLKSCRRDPLLVQRLPNPVASLVAELDPDDQPIDLVPADPIEHIEVAS